MKTIISEVKGACSGSPKPRGQLPCCRLSGAMHLIHAQPRKSPAISWRLQFSDPISSPPAEQAKSAAELGLKYFVICMSYKLLFHKRKTGHDPTKKSARNRREIKKSVPQSPFPLTARVCFLRMSSMTCDSRKMQET
jgi:hypothetical protein